MAVYFSIIISFQKFIPEIEKLMNQYSVYFYVEKWNEEQKFYYELIDIKNKNYSFSFDKDYRRIFFSSLFVEVQEGNLISGKKRNPNKSLLSFYDDSLFHYCIEGEGGREDKGNIEVIRLRRISKTPENQIQKFYNSLQAHFRSAKDIKKGLYLDSQGDSEIYYYKTHKNMLPDFSDHENKYLEKTF